MTDEDLLKSVEPVQVDAVQTDGAGRAVMYDRNGRALKTWAREAVGRVMAARDAAAEHDA